MEYVNNDVEEEEGQLNPDGGEAVIYYDDIVKKLPDQTFYENEQYGENPDNLKSQFKAENEAAISLFVTDAEKAAAAKKKKKLSWWIFMEWEFFGNLLTFFTIYTIFADDFKAWLTSKWSDYPGDAVNIAAFWGFGLEFVCKVD